jgi:AraC-like DNA-binding protein
LKVTIRIPSESVRWRPVPNASKSGQAAGNGEFPPSLYVAPILLTITTVIDSTPFYLMRSHGEGERLPLRHGCVVLSRLEGGRSMIRALAPSVKFVLSGEEVYKIDGRSRAVRPGRFLLVEAGTEFEVSTPRPDETVGLCVYLGVNAPPPADRGPLGRVIEGCGAEPLAPLLSRYARLLASRPETGGALASKIVQQVTAGAEDYLSTFASRLERLSSLKRSTRIETLQRIERARAFIHDHQGRTLTLDEIAAQSALSRFHLSRSFAEVHGLPPLAYHRRLRLEAAARLLRDGAASPTELAERLGYASLSAFTRAFRQAYGVPPSRAQ